MNKKTRLSILTVLALVLLSLWISTKPGKVIAQNSPQDPTWWSKYEFIRDNGGDASPLSTTSTVVSGNAPPGLWQDDGSHPTVAGTYLAACVFYASIFHESPVGLAYDAGLAKELAASLQQGAADTVLTDQAQWGLP